MPLLKGINWQLALDAFFEKAEKIKKGHRLLIFLLLVLLLGGSFVWFVYMPKTEEIGRIEKEVADIKQKIRMGKIWAKKLVKLKEEQSQVEKGFEKALKILPNKREIPNLLAGISELGVESKLQFRRFTPGKEEPKNFYVVIPVSIEVGGRFREVMSFFDKVSRMERIVNIMNISLKPKTPLSTDLITRCKAITYRFKSKADEQKPKGKKKK